MQQQKDEPCFRCRFVLDLENDWHLTVNDGEDQKLFFCSDKCYFSYAYVMEHDQRRYTDKPFRELLSEAMDVYKLYNKYAKKYFGLCRHYRNMLFDVK